tara:strand:- start:268 stop:585 length:318 start_codon:yes stop_codon:yes gene_type:complete
VNGLSDRQLQARLQSRIECNAQILVMQSQFEAERIGVVEHGLGPMLQRPGSGSPLSQRVHHLLHRQLQVLTEGDGLRHRGVTAGHQHLVDRFDLLSAAHVTEMVD